MRSLNAGGPGKATRSSPPATLQRAAIGVQNRATSDVQAVRICSCQNVVDRTRHAVFAGTLAAKPRKDRVARFFEGEVGRAMQPFPSKPDHATRGLRSSRPTSYPHIRTAPSFVKKARSVVAEHRLFEAPTALKRRDLRAIRTIRQLNRVASNGNEARAVVGKGRALDG